MKEYLLSEFALVLMNNIYHDEEQRNPIIGSSDNKLKGYSE